MLVFHCTSWSSWRDHPYLRNAAGCGYVAVSLFFLLSGFILTYVHAAPGRLAALDRRDFYVNRFARIYPAYAFGLALIAPFYFGHTLRTAGAATLIKGALPVLLLVQAYVPSLALVWNPPAWSLSDEAFFYALFPAIAARVVGYRRSTAMAIGVACYAACLAAPLAYLAIQPDGPAVATSESTAFWLNALRYEPFVRVPEFVMGIVLGKLYLDEGVRRPCDERAPIVAAGAIAMIAATLALSPALPYPLLHNGLLAPAFAALVVALASGRGTIASFLSMRPLVALGEASYSLYVIHIPLLIVWVKTVTALAGPRLASSNAWRSACEATFLGVAVVASLLSHRYVEIPLRDRVRAAIGRSRSAPTQRT